MDGQDVLGCISAGARKSAIFAVPIIVFRRNRDLYPDLPFRAFPVGIVVTPTKDLAANMFLELKTLDIPVFAYCHETVTEARIGGRNPSQNKLLSLNFCCQSYHLPLRHNNGPANSDREEARLYATQRATGRAKNTAVMEEYESEGDEDIEEESGDEKPQHPLSSPVLSPTKRPKRVAKPPLVEVTNQERPARRMRASKKKLTATAVAATFGPMDNFMEARRATGSK
ncbi:hypothetical protein B0H13DRAFT_2381766 [Mycena leptocephala]|nr:hypothetical protein B0H13DRAFT_2381766 [Mycena leptocephala]